MVCFAQHLGYQLVQRLGTKARQIFKPLHASASESVNDLSPDGKRFLELDVTRGASVRRGSRRLLCQKVHYRLCTGSNSVLPGMTKRANLRRVLERQI